MDKYEKTASKLNVAYGYPEAQMGVVLYTAYLYQLDSGKRSDTNYRKFYRDTEYYGQEDGSIPEKYREFKEDFLKDIANYWRKGQPYYYHPNVGGRVVEIVGFGDEAFKEERRENRLILNKVK